MCFIWRRIQITSKSGRVIGYVIATTAVDDEKRAMTI